MEQAELARLDWAIGEGEQRVRDQRARVDRLRRQGRDVAHANQVLQGLEEALEE
jgi:hypothetical protein